MDENGINEAMEPVDDESGLTEIEVGDSGAGVIALLIGGAITVGVVGKTAFDKWILPKIDGWKAKRAVKKAKKQSDNNTIIDVDVKPVEPEAENA